MTEYRYIYDYVPLTASHATEKEIRDRNTVLDFMDGDISSELRREILLKIKSITSIVSDCVIVTFIPSSTHERTMQRYGRLASFLSENLDCDVYSDAVALKHDSDPIVLKKDYVCKNSRINGKTVILIGGVINSGKTFEEVRSLLLNNGAREVEGLFVAKVKE